MMKRLALTGLFLIFLCGCAFAMESTNTAADKNDVITIDLAKEPISEASSPDSTEADSPAYKQADNAITAIEVANEFVNITAAKPFKYKVMDKDNQFIKKIDLIGVSAGRFENVILPGSAKVADVTLKPADGHVVVVVTLASAASIKANYSDNTLSLVFNKPEAAVSHPAPAPLPEPKKGHGKNITGVAFYKDSDNAARLEIAADGLISSDVFTLDGRVVVDVHDIKMSAVVPKDIAPPLNAVR
ncbi:MAG: hypothetical protein L7F77_09210, partial [Candidatus Magnetominusculus sp. LBB02]|nr:hypothetical protein [Candidatus Magnetominusculus sp. LBB02]